MSPTEQPQSNHIDYQAPPPDCKYPAANGNFIHDIYNGGITSIYDFSLVMTHLKATSTRAA